MCFPALVLFWGMACYITAIGYIFFADATIHLHLLENLALPKLEEDFSKLKCHLVPTLFWMSYIVVMST
jgi:hypothetical protein